MPDILRTSVSGLIAFQRALATTANNVANVNTEGYSRQRVELVSRVPSPFANGFVGNGVQIAGITRIVDAFAITSLRGSSGQLGQLAAYAEFAGRVDNVLGDPNGGLASGLQSFFNAWQTVANDPASQTNRTLLLQQAQALTDRFRQTSQRLDGIATDLNRRIGGTVAEINALAVSIAQLNGQIATAQARTGQPANDLLDRRDQLLLQLGTLTDVQVNEESDGALSVFVGTGQALVLRTTALELAAVPNEFDPSRLDVAYVSNGTRQVLTGALGSGQLGGLLAVRTEFLDEARNALGRIATGLAEAVNAQQASGMDLRGQLGAALFGLGATQPLAAAGNTGAAQLAASLVDAGALTNDDYVLRFAGGAWTAQLAATGQAVALTGTGTVADPLRVGGLAIVVGGGAPANGDRFLLQPTREAAASLRVVLSDPRGLAAAAPIRTSAALPNLGTGTIDGGEVLDPANPALLAPVTIRFLTPTTYSIDGVGSYAWTPGGDIDVNGWRVRIGGAPAVGDAFRVEPNVGGIGDNRNALAMAGLQTRGVLDGGATSLVEGFGALIGEVGSTTRQARLARDAQAAVTNDARQAVLGVSGVNLDEEAADMLRWQQAYGAAAKVVGVADELFRTLLAAVRR